MTKTSDQITNLDAELDALSSPTTADTYVVSKDYDPDVVAASAARRALGGGGGGGGAVAGAASVIGPYAVAFDTPGIQADGAVVGSFLAVGTVVLDMYVAVTTAFFTGGENNPLQLGVSKGDPANGDTRAISTRNGASSGAQAGGWQRTSGYDASFTGPPLPVVVTAANAVKLFVVNLNDPDPSITGAAAIYALVATL